LDSSLEARSLILKLNFVKMRPQKCPVIVPIGQPCAGIAASQKFAEIEAKWIV